MRLLRNNWVRRLLRLAKAPASGERALPAELRDELAIVQAARMRDQMPLVYAILLADVSAATLAAQGDFPPFLKFVLPTVLMLAFLYRMFATLRLRSKSIDAAEARKYLRASMARVFAFASLASYWSVQSFLVTAPSHRALVPIITTMGVLAVAYCLSIYRQAAISTIVLGLFPISAAMFLQQDTAMTGAGLSIVLVALLQIRAISDRHDQLVQEMGMQQTMRAHANTDALTGLLNRRAFNAAVEEAIGESLGRDEFVFALADLDGFKPVNDRFGHHVGDALLRDVAERLCRALPQKALLARIGGDEFGILFPPGRGDVREGDALRAALDSLAQPFWIDGHSITIGASGGMASFPRDGLTGDALAIAADAALYADKKLRKGGLADFSAPRGAQIEAALLSPQLPVQLQVAMQSIRDTQSEAICGYEALARWRHPELGDISPDEFIPVMDNSPQLSRLSELLFEKAVQAAKAWPDEHRLAFNLSAIQLVMPGTPLMMAAVMARNGFAPSRLSAELTETAPLANRDAARSVLAALKTLGVEMVLDDFGCGYASIAYLRDFDFDRIKIDGGLTELLDASDHARELVRGIVQMARSMGMKTTVERVETAEQLAWLKRIGCDHVQGFYFDRPALAEPSARPGILDMTRKSAG